MSHFYAKLNSGCAKTEPTRRGTKSTGHGATVASWNGAIEVSVWHDEKTGTDRFQVSMIPWHGSGDQSKLAQGELGNRDSVRFTKYAADLSQARGYEE